MLTILAPMLSAAISGVFNWFIVVKLFLIRKHLHFISTIFLFMFSLLSLFGPFSIYNLSSVAVIHTFSPDSEPIAIISRCENFYWIWFILLTFIPYVNTGLLFIRCKILKNSFERTWIKLFFIDSLYFFLHNSQFQPNLTQLALGKKT